MIDRHVTPTLPKSIVNSFGDGSSGFVTVNKSKLPPVIFSLITPPEPPQPLPVGIMSIAVSRLASDFVPLYVEPFSAHLLKHAVT